jgi:hypothetical protein
MLTKLGLIENSLGDKDTNKNDDDNIRKDQGYGMTDIDKVQVDLQTIWQV